MRVKEGWCSKHNIDKKLESKYELKRTIDRLQKPPANITSEWVELIDKTDYMHAEIKFKPKGMKLARRAKKRAPDPNEPAVVPPT